MSSVDAIVQLLCDVLVHSDWSFTQEVWAMPLMPSFQPGLTEGDQPLMVQHQYIILTLTTDIVQ